MKVSFGKCCHKEADSPFGVSSGLADMVEEGHSDADSGSLYYNLSVSIEFDRK